MELDRLGRFLGIEECCSKSASVTVILEDCPASLTRIHRTWSYIVHTHTPCLRFLANASGKVLHGCLRPGIGGIEPGKSTQQCSHDGDDLAIIRDVAGSCFEYEKGRLGIDSIPVSKSALVPISTVNKVSILTTYANIESYSSSEISVIGFFSTLPTVFTTMSIWPKSLSTESNSLSTAAAEVKSPW